MTDLNETTVDHWRNRHEYPMARWQYIGRSNARAGIAHDSPYANPFIIGKDGDRFEVIAKYRAWLPTQAHLMKRLPQLKGRVLLCWCRPESACHGDVLREFVEASE